MEKRRFRRAQSILEYTLLLGAIIAVIVAVLLANGGIRDRIRGVYDRTGQALQDTTTDLTGGIFR